MSNGSNLQEALREGAQAARLAWPELASPLEEFVGYLSTKLPTASASCPLSALRALRIADLYLVYGCIKQEPRALVALEARCFPEVDRVLLRMKVDPVKVDDIKGNLRERLLFPKADERSPLLGYSGRGDVEKWIRSIAVRDAFKVLRASRETTLEEEDLKLASPADNPELAYLKAAFAVAFKSALEEAVTSLTVRERNLLRQYILDGLSVDKLGQLYRVHRATAARWVADVRKQLLEDVRRKLMKCLDLSEGGLQSVMYMARSQLDVSVHRLLRQTSM